MKFDIIIIEKLVKQIIPIDFTYEIKQSDVSESIYLKLWHKEVSRLIRVSDHPTKQHIKNCYIGKSTKKEKIIKTINNLINEIKWNNVIKSVDNLEKEIFNDN